ncbi:MAG: hypothetical protein JXM69_19345 [Anaerolineae bacterium]|nr:hypothetical protein [Anaerolineae bacterium]
MNQRILFTLHPSSLILTLALTCLLLTGCGDTSSPTAIVLPPSATPSNTPAPTETPSPSPTSTPTLNLPVLASTPVPMSNEPITPENVDQIQQLAVWGKGRIEQLAYSPDGKYLAVGTTAGVWIYDAETLEELRFINTGNFVLSLAFTSDSRKLVTDVGTSTVMTWDVTTGEKLDSIQVRDGFLSSGAGSIPQSVFSAGAKLLIATLDDWTVGLWDVAGGKHLRTIGQIFEMGRDGIKTLAISPDGTLLATGGYSEIKVWDARAGDLLYSLPGLEKTIYSLAFSPGDKATMLLAVEGNEGQVQL